GVRVASDIHFFPWPDGFGCSRRSFFDTSVGTSPSIAPRRRPGTRPSCRVLRWKAMSAPGPVIAYPPELPVSAARDEIARAIRDNQVVIVAGATGSGKTTQLPKICLELGRTKIAHTQPRRIAARSIAERIAEELQVPLGTTVGYKV